MGRPLPGEGTFGYWSGGADFREWGLTAKSMPSSIPARILKYPAMSRPDTHLATPPVESLSKADYGPRISMLHATSVLPGHCPVTGEDSASSLYSGGHGPHPLLPISYYQNNRKFCCYRDSRLDRVNSGLGSRKRYFKFY